jgi:uncharacterized protein
MTKVFLDTNVFVSATFWRGKPYEIVELAARRNIQNYVSGAIINEYESVLRRDFGVDVDRAKQAANTVLLFSMFIKPTVRHNVVKDDPDDNAIVDCAVAAKADYIITQDKHLLKIKTFKGIEIITPKEYFEKS